MSIKTKFKVLIFLSVISTCNINGRTIRILAIGNSFSRDAIEQNLHELAEADGEQIVIGNMFIGGCSIERHLNNIHANANAYVYRKIDITGEKVEKDEVSIEWALKDEQWDYISVQQASPLSGVYDTYKGLPEMLSYIRSHVSQKTKIIFHQTWAYAYNATNTGFKTYGNSQMTMYKSIVDVTKRVAKENNINMIVPCGTAIQNARSSFIGDNLNRDGYHLNLTYGRYIAACTWYEILFHHNVIGNKYAPQGLNKDLITISQLSAHNAVISPFSITNLRNIKPSTELYKDAFLPSDLRVSDLLSRMSREEKILQLNQYTLGFNNNINNKGEEVKNLPAGIGSLIYFETSPDLRNKMQERAIKNTRLGIPIIFGFDVIHGFRTIYPISLAQGCSWNPHLIRLACNVAAQEAKMAGVDWTFSPMIDVCHDPRWGRVAECYGEDPYTNGIFGAASVRGYQGKNMKDSTSIAACLKHFIGYGASEAGRDYVYTEISRQSLWDTYLVPYKMCVDAGAATVMSSFNDISGTPGSANHYTMTDVLKDKWGFKGFVVSDWAAIEQLINQGNAENKKEATKLAVNAGVDMDMQSHAYDTYLSKLIDEHDVDSTRVDDAVRRILKVKFDLGLFEHPYTSETSEKDRFLRQESMDIAEKLAEESIVLLKNDKNTLPISNSKKIAVIGPLAKNAKGLLGRWAGHGRESDVNLLFDGIKNEFSDKSEVRYAQGCDINSDDTNGIKDAVKAAKWADIVILCLGEDGSWSGENASRAEITLPKIQKELIEKIKSTGKRIIIVLNNGRPLQLNDIEPFADAIIEAWQPGINGAKALGGILSGRINPSGRLDITFPYSEGQIPIYYNRRKSARRQTQGLYIDMTSNPMYCFGDGLSYTTYKYGEIKASKTYLNMDDTLTLTIPVTNIGRQDGKETVFWFVSDPYSTITRPEKELKYFEKKMIKKGETATYTFKVDLKRDFGFIDGDGNKIIKKGEYDIIVKDKIIKLNLK